MTATEPLLLVGRGRWLDELAHEMTSFETVMETDLYQALHRMFQQRWSCVVLAAGESDLPALCRASRRIRPDGLLLAVCEPTQEAQVRPLSSALLDDYYVGPLTQDDLHAIRRRLDRPAVAPPIADNTLHEAPAGLLPDEYAQLVASSRSMAGLEACIARLAEHWTTVPVEWIHFSDVPAGVEPLLHSAGPLARALVTCDRQAPAAGASSLAALAQCLPSLRENASRYETMHRMATSDHLTGAYNRRYFYALTDQILMRAAAEGFRASLLLYDIDNFKHYNDTYGYAAGDEILRQTAELMRRTCRSHDIVARIGGDEFAVLFWDAQPPRAKGSQPLKTAYDVAERFRRALLRHTFSLLGPEATGKLNISGGLAAFPQDGRDVRALLRGADLAIKRAKNNGKGRIQIVGQPD